MSPKKEGEEEGRESVKPQDVRETCSGNFLVNAQKKSCIHQEVGP